MEISGTTAICVSVETWRGRKEGIVAFIDPVSSPRGKHTPPEVVYWAYGIESPVLSALGQEMLSVLIEFTDISQQLQGKLT